eukprot:gene3664-8331_t
MSHVPATNTTSFNITMTTTSAGQIITEKSTTANKTTFTTLPTPATTEFTTVTDPTATLAITNATMSPLTTSLKEQHTTITFNVTHTTINSTRKTSTVVSSTSQSHTSTTKALVAQIHVRMTVSVTVPDTLKFKGNITFPFTLPARSNEIIILITTEAYDSPMYTNNFHLIVSARMYEYCDCVETIKRALVSNKFLRTLQSTLGTPSLPVVISPPMAVIENDIFADQKPSQARYTIWYAIGSFLGVIVILAGILVYNCGIRKAKTQKLERTQSLKIRNISIEPIPKHDLFSFPEDSHFNSIV